MFKILKSIKLALIISLIFTLASCSKGFFKPGDARKISPDPRERVKKNIEEGKGFRLSNAIGGGKGTTFEFASSNELWRASLDVLDFMPLTSANYSGGIIITDWYNDGQNFDESIKITLRFLSNEIRSDSIKIIVHNKKCKTTQSFSVNEIDSNIKMELRQSILRKASLLEKESKKKKKK